MIIHNTKITKSLISNSLNFINEVRCCIIAVNMNLRRRVTMKLFYLSGIPFGLFLGSLVGLQTSVGRGLGTVGGIFFGFIMTFILWRTYKKSAEKVGLKGIMVPNQSKKIKLDCPVEMAFDKCLDALNQFTAKIKSKNEARSEIKGFYEVSSGF